ncbi:Sporulation-specific protein spo7 [Colletotrichum chlorophyti]|uniref:Sporulation-specific protein spo7 n=1 Tax=Colletotrichum chlorophyti TaxID=708187 RepID=A0A1Q8S804_9PEZI|nr:Sporulation-specific protein spo7 [Colletotrichum chlorophyti]
MADELDSLVKGAPPPGKEMKAAVGTTGVVPESGKQGDPLSHTPSSPSMIYLNLLILEASLRAQYLELRARRRHHTFFFTLLTAWVCGFGYALFFAPREDGRGVGGSVYWGVETFEKICFMGGVMTAILVWATGIWERGIRWPRRWFAVSNRGLRGFNSKLVIIRRSWWAELLSTIGFFLTYGLFSHTASSSYRYVEPSILREVEKELSLTAENHPTLPVLVEDEEKGGHEEDLAPGGDYVKLLLLAKPFTPTFRENWEIYRTEYWEKENERRALIQKKLAARDRQAAKQRWGMFWWLPWHRIDRSTPPPARHVRDPEKTTLHPRAAAIEREHRRRSSTTSAHRRSSTSSSRSITPSVAAAAVEDTDGTVSRKASTGSNASEKRKKKLSSVSKTKRPNAESRSVTPDIPSPLARESSVSRGDSGSGAESVAERSLRHSSSKASISSSTNSVREKQRKSSEA